MGPSAQLWKNGRRGDDTTESWQATSRHEHGHLLWKHTRKQKKITARGSTEAELYAAALGATESKGIGSLMCDGLAKAREHILRTRNWRHEAQGEGGSVRID